ncbi:MAG: hypothetical protein ACFE85_07925 [Candidatus Hodarchaeota archaeon]
MNKKVIIRNIINEMYCLKTPNLSIKKQILPKNVNDKIGYNTNLNRKGSTPIISCILLLGKKILKRQELGRIELPIRKIIDLK